MSYKLWPIRFSNLLFKISSKLKFFNQLDILKNRFNENLKVFSAILKSKIKMSIQKVIPCTSKQPNDGKIFVKLKPLKTNYRVLTWLCVCPPEESISWRKQLVYISLISTILIGFIIILMTSAAFLIENMSVDLEKSLYALAQIDTYFGITYTITMALFLRQEITGLFNSLSHIYAESKL